MVKLQTSNLKSQINPKSQVQKNWNLEFGIWNFRALRGQVLAELLVAITVGVVLAAIGAQLTSVSLQASRSSRQQNEAMGLAQEGVEAMRAIVRSNSASSQGWNKMYLPPDGTGASSTKGVGNPFHPEVISNEWRLVAGAEPIVVEGGTYMRTIIIENVARSSSTSAILDTYDGVYDDPATQKVRVIVSRTGYPDVELVSYFTRYVNESTLQTDWSGSVSDVPVAATSTPTSVGSATESNNIDRTGTPGSIKLKSN